MKTQIFRRRVENCDNKEDLFKLLQDNEDAFITWKTIFQELMQRCYNPPMHRLAQYCGVSEGTAKTWKSKVPTKRDYIIAIGMFCRLDLGEINRLLKRYAKFSELYPKNPEDAIYIFLINNNRPFIEAKKYQSLFIDIIQKKEKRRLYGFSSKGTNYVKNELLQARTESEFETFMLRNADEFKSAYIKVAEYLDAYLKAQGNANINKFAKQQNEKVGRLYNNAYTKLKNYAIVPKRSVLLAMAINIGMTPEDIDQLLELAGMEKLCPKDRLECMVIYILEDLYINEPDNIPYEELRKSKNELLRNKYSSYIWDEFECDFYNLEKENLKNNSSSEIAQYFSDAGELKYESIGEYVKRRLEEVAGRKKEDKTFIDLL